MPVNDTSKANLIPFAKNEGEKKDKRINRKGRITNFAQLRKLAQEIGNESLSETEAVTRFKALLRVMSSSRNPADRKTFLEYAVGKVKDEVDLTSGGEALKNQIVQIYIPSNDRDTDPK